MVRSLAIFAAATAVVASAQVASGFNELGHSVIGKVAYDRLTAAQRSAVHDVLKHHPHYTEYLAAKKPDAVDVEQWAFIRATTWADWVRGRHREQYHHGEWHYVNFPYTLGAPTADLPEPIDQPKNILERLPKALRMVKTQAQTNSLGLLDTLTPDQRRAVALTWAFHLIGDLHQPLHVVAMVDEARWPAADHGDQGGNLVAVVIDGPKPTKLHAFWDGALGLPMSLDNLTAVVASFESDPPMTGEELARRAASRKFKDWATEGYQLAARYAYLDGTLRPAPWRDAYNRGAAADPDVPVLPESVKSETKKVYRQQLWLGGVRLANQLKLLF